MIRDIGSIFSLYDRDLTLEGDVKPISGRYLYGLCREAILEIAKQNADTNKVVLLPAYTCGTVVLPFEQAGWKIEYFSILRNLRIDIVSLQEKVSTYSPSIVLVHPYFGQDLSEEEIAALLNIKELGSTKIVVDLTQSIFTQQRFEWVDYYVGSIYKWLPVVDGGFLETTEDFTMPEEENQEYVQVQRDAMYLRGLYFDSGIEEVKSISRRVNNLAKKYIGGGLTPHRISAFSQHILANADWEKIQKLRWKNYRYLRDNIKDLAGMHVSITDDVDVKTAPLYLPIYCEDRVSIQTKLAKERIYAPVLWPIYNDSLLINEDVRWIYEHVLVIPVDQRCSLEDMKRIIDVLKK